MANLLQTLTDHDYRNWVKGGLGLKFARDGIESFVENSILQFHQDILNSLSAQCNTCSTENTIQCKYNNNFCKFINSKCTVHDPKDPKKKSKLRCPNSVCNVVRDEIFNNHRCRGPSWYNTDCCRWCQEPWQLATCYMPAGYATSKSARDTDFPGLLSVIINNKCFDTEVTENLRNKHNVFCKARDARNEILHKPDMQLSDTELAGYISTLNDMLSDSKRLIGHTSAVRARSLLQQILKDTVSISTIDADEIRADALKAIKDRKSEALESIEAKEISSVAAVQKAEDEAKSRVDEAIVAIDTKETSSIDALHKAEDQAKSRVDETIVAIETKEVSSIAAVHKAENEAKSRVDEALIAIETKETSSIDALHKAEDQAKSRVDEAIVAIETKETSSIDALHKAEDQAKSRVDEAIVAIETKETSCVAAVHKAENEAKSRVDEALVAIETKETSSIDALHKAEDQAKSRVDEAIVVIETKETSSVAAVHKAETEAKSRVGEALVAIETKETSSIAAVHKAEEESTCRFKSASKESHDQNAKALKKELLSIYEDGDHMSTSLGPIATDEDKHIDELYVEPYMKLVNHRRAYDDGVRVQSYREIFKPENKKIYVVGKAGTGKTSLCQKIVSTWCKTNTTQKENMSDSQQTMAKFDYLFYISLRDVISDNTLEEMIKHLFLPNKPSLHEPLSRVLEEENCLIILDGLDEWTTENKTAAVNRGLPGRDAVRNCTVLTTTRPWKLESLRLKTTQIDTKIELIGIDKTSSAELVQKMIEHLNDKFNCQRTYEKYVSELEDKKLDELMIIPVILKQIVCLWHSGKTLGKSKTAIYSQMMELQFELAQKRLIEDPYFQQIEDKWMKSSIKLPSCYDDNEICQGFKPLILALSELSFHALLSDAQESSLVFKTTRKGCYNLSQEDVNICLKIGILSQNKILIDCTSQFKKVSFLHKTFQEFLAAMCVSMKKSDTQHCVETLQQFCSTEANCRDMTNVLTFISGLCPPDITCTLLDLYDTKNIAKQPIIIDCMREGWTCIDDNKHLYFEEMSIHDPSEHLDKLCEVNIRNITSLSISYTPSAQCLNHLQNIHGITTLYVSSANEKSPPIDEELLYALISRSRGTLRSITLFSMTLRSRNTLWTFLEFDLPYLENLSMSRVTLPQQLVDSLRAFDRSSNRQGLSSFMGSQNLFQNTSLMGLNSPLQTNFMGRNSPLQTSFMGRNSSLQTSFMGRNSSLQSSFMGLTSQTALNRSVKFYNCYKLPDAESTE